MNQDAADVASRDQQMWDLQVRNTEASASMSEASAALVFAKASFWLRLSHLVRAANVFTFCAALAVLIIPLVTR